MHLRTRLMHLSHSITKTQFIYLFVFHLVSLLFYSHAIYASTSSAIPFPPGSRLSAHRTPLSFESIFYWLIKAILPRPHCNRAFYCWCFAMQTVFFQNATKGFYFYSLMAKMQLCLFMSVKNYKALFFYAHLICTQQSMAWHKAHQ